MYSNKIQATVEVLEVFTANPIAQISTQTWFKKQAMKLLHKKKVSSLTLLLLVYVLFFEDTV